MTTEVPNEDLKNTTMQLKDIENYTTSANLIA